ncbi:TetR family transcriptional regulator [Geodermatophilus sp. SYSU D01119]
MRKASTRARILEAARQLFAEHGYDTVTVSAIGCQRPSAARVPSATH